MRNGPSVPVDPLPPSSPAHLALPWPAMFSATSATAVFALLILSVAVIAAPSTQPPTPHHDAQASNAFGQGFVPRNMLVLGDSYSDSCNTQRYAQNDDKDVPFPTCYPVPQGRADRGPAWPEYFRQLQGQVEVEGGPPGGQPSGNSHNQTNVVNMAFSAATCDNGLFPRKVPSVGDALQLVQNGFNGTLASGFGPRSVVNAVNGDTDVAVMWIGTNDLSFFATNTTRNETLNLEFAIDNPSRGGDILDYIGCIFGRFGQLYEFGYRKFVLIEMIPLELTPQYNHEQVVDEKTGVVPFGLPTVIQQATLSANFLYKYKAKDFEEDFSGAKVEIFPAHELFRRFYFHKEEYGFENVNTACTNCTLSPDENLWADELHPSARASRLLSVKLSRFLKGDRGEALLRGQE